MGLLFSAAVRWSSHDVFFFFFFRPQKVHKFVPKCSYKMDRRESSHTTRKPFFLPPSPLPPRRSNDTEENDRERQKMHPNVRGISAGNLITESAEVLRRTGAGDDGGGEFGKNSGAGRGRAGGGRGLSSGASSSSGGGNGNGNGNGNIAYRAHMTSAQKLVSSSAGKHRRASTGSGAGQSFLPPCPNRPAGVAVVHTSFVHSLRSRGA